MLGTVVSSLLQTEPKKDRANDVTLRRVSDGVVTAGSDQVCWKEVKESDFNKLPLLLFMTHIKLWPY